MTRSKSVQRANRVSRSSETEATVELNPLFARAEEVAEFSRFSLARRASLAENDLPDRS